MPTTSNFGWTTPADTDLVKNGALAIRTLGNGIDTTMAELKGGTTGQILSKTSDSDMDFTWIANDQGDITAVNAGTGLTGGGTTGAVTLALDSTAVISPTIVDAKGDIIAATAADTVTRLAVGSNNQVLTADSTTATGLKWATPSGSGANWSLVNAGGTNLTGATTITISGISNVERILILLENCSAGASSQIGFRLNGVTTSSYSGNGIMNYHASTWSADLLSHISFTDNRFYSMQLTSDGSSTGSASCLLSGCNSSGVKVATITGGAGGSGGAGTGQNQFAYSGFFNSSSTISSVSAFSSSGNFDAGKIYVYTSAN